jgi:hypothetical protein
MELNDTKLQFWLKQKTTKVNALQYCELVLVQIKL